MRVNGQREAKGNGDRGSERVKATIQAMVHKFIDDDGSLKPGQIKPDDINPIDPVAMITASVPR